MYIIYRYIYALYTIQQFLLLKSLQITVNKSKYKIYSFWDNISYHSYTQFRVIIYLYQLHPHSVNYTSELFIGKRSVHDIALEEYCFVAVYIAFFATIHHICWKCRPLTPIKFQSAFLIPFFILFLLVTFLVFFL